MPWPEPGRWPWLLRHELRLLWRAFGVRSWLMAGMAVLFLLLFHAGAYLMWRAGAIDQALAKAPALVVTMSAFVLLLVQSAAFGLAVRALFERSDLDLLLSAPVPVAHVFAARGVAVACGSVAALALFALPFANAAVFTGRWAPLAAYPVLLALGLAGAGIAFGVTLVLVRLLGLRRARVAAQLTGASVGVVLLLLMQAESLLPRAWRQAIVAWTQSDASLRWLGPESVLLWPVRAMLGEPLPFAAVMLASIALFAAVVRVTAGRFAEAAQDAAGVLTPARARAVRGGTAFREGLARIVVRKELLLMARDPMLIAKSLLQVLYLVPLFVIMLRQHRATAVIAAALVLLVASIAATLAWIAVSGEEAPDLLRSAPVPMARLRALKVLGATLPALVLASPFVLWYAVRSPATALVLLPFLAAAVASSAMVQVWTTPLGVGREFKPRGQALAVRLVDTVASFGWAAGCYFAIQGSPWALAGIAVGFLGPACGALAHRRLRREGAA